MLLLEARADARADADAAPAYAYTYGHSLPFVFISSEDRQTRYTGAMAYNALRGGFTTRAREAVARVRARVERAFRPAALPLTHAFSWQPSFARRSSFPLPPARLRLVYDGYGEEDAVYTAPSFVTAHVSI